MRLSGAKVMQDDIINSSRRIYERERVLQRAHIYIICVARSRLDRLQLLSVYSLSKNPVAYQAMVQKQRGRAPRRAPRKRVMHGGG